MGTDTIADMSDVPIHRRVASGVRTAAGAQIPLSALLMVLAWTGPAAAQAPAYSGKYARDPAFQKIIRDLDQKRRDALAEVKARLGLEAADAARIVIAFEDAIPAKPQTLARFEGAAFETSGSAAGKKEVRILIRPEFLVSGRHDLPTELAHEMVHAVMRQRMSEEAYGAVPKWAREGLAVWCAKQTGDRFLARLVSAKAFRDPERVFPGIDRGEHGFDRYAEYGAAFDHLAAADAAAPGRFAGLLLSGVAAAEAVGRITGGTFDAFRAAARARCLERARALEPPGLDDWLAIATADKAREYERVRDEAERFLKDHPDGPLVADVLYWHGKACRLLKTPARGEKNLERILRDHAAHSDYVDESLYQLGSGKAETRHHEEALKHFERILRDIPDAANQDRILLRIAQCSLETGDKPRAAHALGLLEKSFPGSPVLKEAAPLLKKL